jgi:hypothetical protein
MGYTDLSSTVAMSSDRLDVSEQGGIGVSTMSDDARRTTHRLASSSGVSSGEHGVQTGVARLYSQSGSLYLFGTLYPKLASSWYSRKDVQPDRHRTNPTGCFTRIIMVEGSF